MAALADWITDVAPRLPDGVREFDLAVIPLRFAAAERSGGRPGVFLRRAAPNDDTLSARVGEQIRRMRKKLMLCKAQGYTTVLLLESNDQALMNQATKCWRPFAKGLAASARRDSISSGMRRRRRSRVSTSPPQSLTGPTRWGDIVLGVAPGALASTSRSEPAHRLGSGARSRTRPVPSRRAVDDRVSQPPGDGTRYSGNEPDRNEQQRHAPQRFGEAAAAANRL
jgi:hypothetical protein